MTAKPYIGTSGWSYQGWKDSFYAGVPRKNWLIHCARQFTGIEVNATFYGLQKRSTFERWHTQTPDDFKFAIKGNKFLTHNKKLLEPLEPIEREKDRASGLGKKLAVVIWQLPQRFQKEMDRLTVFLKALDTWPETRHTIEFRHKSWFAREVENILQQHRVAVCISDGADWPLWDAVSTDLVYVRLHGHTKTYASKYTEEELHYWASRTREWLRAGYDVHVYFDNDAEGAAPYDALLLLELIR